MRICDSHMTDLYIYIYEWDRGNKGDRSESAFRDQGLPTQPYRM